MKRVRVFQRGSLVLKVILAVSVAMLVAGIGWFSYAEQRREYWDDKVREMCAKEGAAVALQRVEIARGDAIPPTPDERYADAGAEYVSRWREEVIRPASPRVLRTEVTLIRVHDQKSLGRQIRYARIGGDPGFVDNPSTFSCRDIGIKSVESLILSVKETK